MNEPPLVRIAANCIRRMIYQYRDDFVAGMIVAGWDKKLGGQVNLYINSILNCSFL
jgi:20S proteasome subunit beta 1